MDLGMGDLTDEALRAEIELIGELIVAASASPGRLARSEIDGILGVHLRPLSAAGIGSGSNLSPAHLRHHGLDHPVGQLRLCPATGRQH